MTTPPALLLLGPTGSGKTPLGDALERNGLHGMSLAHFDFGRELRSAAAAPEQYPVLGQEDIAVIRRALTAGALLTDGEFPIAAGILRSFLDRIPAGTAAVVMNGLPRHTGQAKAVAELIRIEHVIVLECSAETVYRRITRNSGGDRSGRADDSPEEIARKLAVYSERTAPLIGHYRETGAGIVTVDIGMTTGPAEIITVLRDRIPI
ncbi:nucleoside monophosphate kinase [bacterium]|nr:nucleoside monophosphate kinase [bacterium]